MRSYGSSTDLISNYDLLQPHRHTDPIGRDHQIEQLKNALEPLERGHKPTNIAVYGPPGTGKTTCIRHVFSQLSEHSVATAQINCATYSTRSAVVTHILETLGYVAPKKGHAIDTKLSKLKQQLDQTDLAIALDEIDKLDDLNDIIYDLYETGVRADNHVALILSCDKPPEDIDFDHRSLSRLQYRTIRFDPYSTQQLRDILSDRVDRAFKKKAVEETVIDRIAEHVSNEMDQGSGDIRCAIDLLRMAGQRAERECHSKVAREDVEAVLQPGQV